MLNFSCPKSSSKVNIFQRTGVIFQTEIKWKEEFCKLRDHRGSYRNEWTSGWLAYVHWAMCKWDARLPTGKRMSSSDFLGHFLGRTSYDATVKHDSCRFLCLYNQLGKKKSQLPLRIGMSQICQVAGKHSPAVCNVPSACTVSVKCVLAFWVAFTSCIVDSVLIQILLDNSCLIYGLFFITWLWERYVRAQAWLSNGVSHVALGNMVIASFQMATPNSAYAHLDHVRT